ncbi:MAG: hypothetical protein Q4B70_09185 [Lachnospiraceae bacterium]|nr:hypothetical protein [Lachnospiraceae bacterium]
MKKILSVLVTVFMILSLAGCGNSNSGSNSSTNETEQSDESADTTDTESQMGGIEGGESGVLVAYFSRTGENYGVGTIEKGNTAIIAEMIAEEVNGGLFEIRTVESYPEDYDETTEIAQQELREKPLSHSAPMQVVVYQVQNQALRTPVKEQRY